MADEEQNENVEETPAVEAEAAEAPAEKPAKATPASPREQRRQARAERVAKEAGSRPSRTPEERQAERDAVRKAKAARRGAARVKAREKVKAARTGASEPTPPREHGEGRQKTRQGIVISDKADKTITVRIDTARQHRRYHKIVRSSTTLHAHDESNDANVGDTVVVRECRPLSRLKRWRLVEVVERAR